jgi:hypothetical protein
LVVIRRIKWIEVGGYCSVIRIIKNFQRGTFRLVDVPGSQLFGVLLVGKVEVCSSFDGEKLMLVRHS